MKFYMSGLANLVHIDLFANGDSVSMEGYYAQGITDKPELTSSEAFLRMIQIEVMKVQFFLYDTEASHLFIRIECA